MAEPTNDPELDNLPVRAEEQGSSDSLPEFDSGGEMGPANPSRGYQESAASISDSAGISTMEESLRSRIQTTLNAPNEDAGSAPVDKEDKPAGCLYC